MRSPGEDVTERRACRRWRPSEDRLLVACWGDEDIEHLARRLRRTARAVSARALLLRLGPPSRETKTVDAIVRESGYSHSRIFGAVVRLGIVLERARRQDPRQPERVDRWAVTDEQERSILSFLAGVPDGRRLYTNRGQRTQAGVWGVGRKPAACLGCGTTERPHRANGRCRACSAREYRARDAA